MTAPQLHLYNSLSRRVEPFAPLDPSNVRVYSCGPTVYDYAHLGNLRAYVFTDTLARTLRREGFPLTHVLNITDVGHLQSDADQGDDKMEKRARETGRDIWAIARHYTATFKQNLRDLNILEPTRMPLATDHVPEMIDFARHIADRHCYLLDTGLYFDTATVPDYGRLARDAADAVEGRIDAVPGKRQPQDCAIWRRSAPDERRQMEWDSPWGRGAPGWHLECSVMSRLYLGERFDIHTGGIDHREVHHPNEIAQNQARCDCEHSGATFWMHNNFLVDRAGKMAKSAGEFMTLRSVVDRGFHPLAYRLMCLQAHYRSEMEFAWDGLAAASVRLKRLLQSVEAARARAGHATDRETEGGIDAALARFDDAIRDDLGTPRALVALDAVLGLARDAPSAALAAVERMDAILGLGLATLRRQDLRTRPVAAHVSERDVERLLEERRHARETRDFARSDRIRDELAAGGVEVMDGDPLGWDWRPRP